MVSEFRLSQTVEAGGCSAKLSPQQLEDILKQVPVKESPNVVVSSKTHDDAGIISLPSGEYLIQTTDFFPPMVDDPFVFGEVAAANALSDVYAMGGKPICAMSLVMFPSQSMDSQILVNMLKGGTKKVEEAGATIIGGHTIDDEPLKYGLAVTGIIKPENLVTNSGAKPGDLLILTKALGTAILTGARKVGLITEKDVQPAIEVMTMLNKTGAEIMVKAGVKAATDITGFGLLGHAYRLASASNVTFRIETKSVPALPGAIDLIKKGGIPGGSMRNLEFVRKHIVFLPSLKDERKWLTLDPQTSGGLLMSVSPVKANKLLSDLQNAGLKDASIIGEVFPAGQKSVLIG